MNETQRILYTQTSRVLENKEKKRAILFSNEVTGSTFLNRSIYINRFDGVFQTSDIQIENYNSSSFCDVQQDAFWDFLYSNLWSDKGILRVFSGELYTALDISLNEMLQTDKISRHVTTAFLKVKCQEKKDDLKFDLSPEIVQVEFTYYNRINSTEFSDSFSDRETESDTNFALNSDYPSDVSMNKNSKAKLEMEVMPQPDESLSLVISNPPPHNEPHVIKINLGHFYCPITYDIENDVESDYESLENEIQKGNWMTNERLGRTTSKITMLKSELQDSKWPIKKQHSRTLKSSKEDLQVTEVDVKERFLMPISIDIDLTVLGNIMEREKYLKFKKMSPKERKKFFLSDERLIKTSEKLKSEDLGETKWEIPHQLPRKTSRKQVKMTDIKNMHEFATFVLGISESPTIYRILIWLGKCEDEEKAKSTSPISESDFLRTRHANFDVENGAEDLLQLESKELFKSRNKRSFVKTFTYHPKVFTPKKIAPLFEIKRLRRSYSPEHYKKRYSWEKNIDCKFHLTKTKITIPDLSICKLEISTEMILKVLGDFIVRKERVISNKGVSFTSIAFIRPVYFNNLFF